MTCAGARVQVAPVRSRKDLKEFLQLPWRLYAGDRAWVPPLLSDLKRVLDRRRHPFHQHADVEYLLARRGGAVVGRIAAIVNHRHVEFQREKAGFFGFFESAEDDDVARTLLEVAETWVRARGMERIRGPMNFSTNDEFASPGVLLDGFEHAPAILMSHTRPYYPGLLTRAGYVKSKDLLAYWLEGPEPPERLVRGVARLQEQQKVRLRPLDMRHFAQEVRTVQDIYNSAWEQNWGFVPLSEAEIRYLAKQLRPVLKPELCPIAEVADEAVGFAVALPDLHQALRHINGRLWPFGLLKLLWHARKIDAARVLTLGLKPGFRRMGIDAMLYLRIFQEGPRLGYPHGECSWILEDNWEMRRGLERMGAHVYKTYRVYEKAV